MMGGPRDGACVSVEEVIASRAVPGEVDEVFAGACSV
jgi:hypothetical protein